ncbi:hypothetical protein SUGI_0460380 [Cryptomeria japonica]|nr:hypothetical protein SUGI_0460380 [Cryptomeria japonica]
MSHYGLQLQWVIDLGNCSTAKGTANYSCTTEAQCINSQTGDGHACKCLPGYEGSGYSKGTACIKRVEYFWWLKRQQLKHAGDKNFLENGGIEMEQRFASMGGRKSLLMFSEKELEIASNNYKTSTVSRKTLVLGKKAANRHRDGRRLWYFSTLVLGKKAANRHRDGRRDSRLCGSRIRVRSNQFTEKSDVYSFGVVLVELFAGLQPVLSRQGEMYTLSSHLISTIDGGGLTES